MSRRMTSTTFIIVLAIAAGVSFGLLFLLRDGGSGLNDYFQELAPLINTIDDRSGAQRIEAPNQAFAAWGFVVSQTANDLEDIDPPGTVAEAHQELTSAMADVAAGMLRLSAENANVGTLEEAEQLRNQDEELRAADGRARAACAELEQIAEENDIPVDLELC